MSLYVHPDYRTLLWKWSAAQAELTDLVDDRIYTEALPSVKTYPLAKITQLTDPDLIDGTHAAVDGLFQFDVWGGSPTMTHTIAETWRALLIQRLVGPHDDFIAGAARCGGISRTTETVESQAIEGSDTTESSSARPRCRFDARIVLRPARAVDGS